MKTTTKRKAVLLALVLASTIALVLLIPHSVVSTDNSATTTAIASNLTNKVVLEPVPKVPDTPILTAIKGPILTSEQETWRDDLEWCECKGDHTAVNWVDKDGTPSYYAFQFKPGTFRGYGEQYGVIPKGLTHEELMEALKSYQHQKDIVGYMILDPQVNWFQQFPDCVRKLGLPPKG